MSWTKIDKDDESTWPDLSVKCLYDCKREGEDLSEIECQIDQVETQEFACTFYNKDARYHNMQELHGYFFLPLPPLPEEPTQ